jgi:hypothetical protein
MILNKVHQLFTIAPHMPRIAAMNMQLSDIFVPKCLVLETSVHQIHHDPKLWGQMLWNSSSTDLWMAQFMKAKNTNILKPLLRFV